MSKIRILSEHIANQIAAGEVVERPASVVKELVENSLDASADRIEIRVEGGGTGLVRISDNGEGMDEDDVLLAIERHATSKLAQESDLRAIRTLGFRGEALPSITSVARVSILSRPAHVEAGTRAEIIFGQLRKVQGAGCAPGSVIEVRDLFANVPARRKFLKSRRTELYHVEEVVRNLALAHPAVGFTLVVEGRPVFSLDPGEELEQRLRTLYRYDGALLVLEAGDDNDPARVRGFLLEPDAATSPARQMRILVNRRPVRSPLLVHAVGEGLEGFLMKGRGPVGLLLLALAPDTVDVNVHPAKLEVRFHDQAELRCLVQRAARSAVAAMQGDLRARLFSPERPANREAQASGPPPFAPIPRPLPMGQGPPVGARPAGPSAYAPDTQEQIDPTELSQAAETGPRAVSSVEDRATAGPDSWLLGLRVIGQFQDLYLLCESGDQLVVIDQHAAHERILFEGLRREYLGGRLRGQNLLFPRPLELGPREAAVVERHGEALTALGIVLEPFGHDTFVIKALPALIAHLDPESVVAEVLAGLGAGWEGTASRVLSPLVGDLFARLACKAAIKAGRRLEPREMLALLARIHKGDFFSHCPHGRPVIKTFSPDEVKRWFHRT